MCCEWYLSVMLNVELFITRTDSTQKGVAVTSKCVCCVCISLFVCVFLSHSIRFKHKQHRHFAMS